VWTPEELREAKLLELDDQLQNARSRIDDNAAHLSQLEQTAAEAKALTERVQQEKNSLEAELRSEAERLSTEVDRLKRRLRRSWVRSAAVLLPLVGAAAWVTLSDSEPATELRAWMHAGDSTPDSAPSAAIPHRAPAAMPAVAAPAQPDAGAAVALAAAEVSDAGAAEEEQPPDGGLSGTGFLRIGVDRDTSIWVDGKKVGKAPLRALEISAGSHRVRFDCRLEGRRVMSKPRYVQVLPNKEAHLEYICADGD
jgi:hypothetical protein